MIVEKIIDKFTDTISKVVSDKAMLKAIKKTDLTPYINSLSHTKTLYSSDKPILISEFYHKPRVLFQNGKELSDNDFMSLISQHNILLFGQMGQGKSIFLKNLAIDLILNGQLPLFYELRFLKETDSLITNLIELLKDITKQHDLTREIFFKLAEKGNIYLIFDGYDEMGSKVADNFIRDLKQLSLYSNFHIILSSRPEYNAEFSSDNLYKLELDKYKFQDQAALISKLITQKHKDNLNFSLENSQKEINEIISQIKNSETEIQNLLQTPLMVILYIWRLQSKFTPAKNLKEFFNDLFQVAFSRHDITKNNFKRERKSSLGDSELLDIFKLFCFDTKDYSELTFSRNRCLSHLQTAINELNLKERVTSQEVFNEYTQVICFIINAQLNNEFTFLHRSIQDFYAASYISEQDVEHKEVFYSDILEKRYTEFYPCIFFLKEIDRASFIENIELPVIKEFLERYYQSSEISLHKKLNDVFRNSFKIGNWYVMNRIRKQLPSSNKEFSDIEIQIITKEISRLEEYVAKLEIELQTKQQANRKRFSRSIDLNFDTFSL